jgi:hypothetical protein
MKQQQQQRLFIDNRSMILLFLFILILFSFLNFFFEERRSIAGLNVQQGGDDVNVMITRKNISILHQLDDRREDENDLYHPPEVSLASTAAITTILEDSKDNNNHPIHSTSPSSTILDGHQQNVDRGIIAREIHQLDSNPLSAIAIPVHVKDREGKDGDSHLQNPKPMAATIINILKSRKCFSLRNATEEATALDMPSVTFPTTIITGYYDLPSKHSKKDYKLWMLNFLSIHAPMIIFYEDESVLRLIQSSPRQTNELFQNITYMCYFPLIELDVYKRNGEATVWQKQYEIDPERIRHKTTLLYLIWLGKIEFLQFVSDKFNIFESRYFFWKDIGSIRTFKPEYIHGFPNPARVQDYCSEAFVVVLMDIQHFQYCGKFHNGALPSPEDYRNHTTFDFEAKIRRAFTVDGSHQCGTKEAIEVFRPAFEAVTDLFIKSGTFAGKDQTNMFVTHLWKPNLLKLIWNPRKQWFYMSELFRADSDGIPKHISFPSCPKRSILLTDQRVNP